MTGLFYESKPKKEKKKRGPSKLEESLFAEFKLFGLPTPVRQYIFHPTRKWRFDFAWIELKIAVEINGGIFMGGGHNRGGYMEMTYEKINEATKLGWQVYTFGPKSVKIPKVKSATSEALAFMYGLLRKA